MVVAASDWRLLGQFNGPVPASPRVATISFNPYYLGPRERVKLSLHSDHPLGVRMTVPTVAALASDLTKRTRPAGSDGWRQAASQLIPDWLSLALFPSVVGAVQDEWITVLPGKRLGSSPFESLRPLTAAGFVGTIQYEAGHGAHMGAEDSVLERALAAAKLSPNVNAPVESQGDSRGGRAAGVTGAGDTSRGGLRHGSGIEAEKECFG